MSRFLSSSQVLGSRRGRGTQYVVQNPFAAFVGDGPREIAGEGQDACVRQEPITWSFRWRHLAEVPSRNVWDAIAASECFIRLGEARVESVRDQQVVFITPAKNSSISHRMRSRLS